MRPAGLYCVKAVSEQNGRMFPAWQFVDPVPSLCRTSSLSCVGVLQFELPRFSVTQQDDLNELSPVKCWRGCRLKIDKP